LIVVIIGIVAVIAAYQVAVKAAASPASPSSDAWGSAFHIIICWLVWTEWLFGVVTLFAYYLGVVIWIGIVLCTVSLWVIDRLRCPIIADRALRCAVVPFFLFPSAEGVPLWVWAAAHGKCFAGGHCTNVPSNELWPFLYRLLGPEYPRVLAVFAAEAIGFFYLVSLVAGMLQRSVIPVGQAEDSGL
jgi:hypothetical protein